MKKRLSYLFMFLLTMGSYIKVSAATYVDCGKIKHLPYKVLELSNFVVDVMQVAVPVILVLMGTIDLVKAVASQKEDEIKKSQGVFIKRLIMGALVFFVIVIVKLLISVIGNTDGIWGCVECFVDSASKCI